MSMGICSLNSSLALFYCSRSDMDMELICICHVFFETNDLFLLEDVTPACSLDTEGFASADDSIMLMQFFFEFVCL